MHLSALPILEEGKPLGFVMLLHDFGFAERRESQIQRLLVGTFAMLALAASVLTVVIRRASWRGWTSELRRVLHGGLQKPEFQPLMSDVRDLIDRISAERELEGSGGVWTPERLKESLRQRLLRRARRRRGESRAVHPRARRRRRDRIAPPRQRPGHGARARHARLLGRLGGARRGVGRPRDRGREDRVRRAARARSVQLRRVWLTPEEEQGYYYGFANEGLWPLCHIAHTRPIFRARGLGAVPRGQRALRPGGLRGGGLARTRSCSCRTTTSRSCPG